VADAVIEAVAGVRWSERRDIMRTRILIALLVVVVTAEMPRLAIAGCDEPGTPNKEQLRSDHRQLIYSFDNTARVSPGARGDEMGKVIIYFDMNMGERNNPEGHNWTYVEGDGPHRLGNHERVTFRITTQQTERTNPANRRAERVNRPLEVGKTYCMTVWARTSPGGCRSNQHSSWQCATVQP
jgi:hypothetical protein